MVVTLNPSACYSTPKFYLFTSKHIIYQVIETQIKNITGVPGSRELQGDKNVEIRELS